MPHRSTSWFVFVNLNNKTETHRIAYLNVFLFTNIRFSYTINNQCIIGIY